MTGQIKVFLEKTLQDIDDNSFKSFKRKLNEVEEEGVDKIPLCNLKDKNPEEVVDLVWRHYTANRAPQLVIQLLDNINERQLSQDLQNKIDNVLLMLKTEKTPGKSLSSATPLGDRTNQVSAEHYHRHVHQTYSNGQDPHGPIVATDSPQISPQGVQQPATQRPTSARKSLILGRRSRERGKPLPDITLIPLTEDDIKKMREDHQGRPSAYACLLFKNYVPFNIFKKWAKNINFDGYGGKRAIPKNLLDEIMKEVRKEFRMLKPQDKKEIQNKLNYLLKNPPKTGWPRQF